MRQGKDITIHSLVGKNQKKKTGATPAAIKMKTVYIGDNMNTQFVVPEGKDSQKVINRYLESRRYK